MHSLYYSLHGKNRYKKILNSLNAKSSDVDTGVNFISNFMQNLKNVIDLDEGEDEEEDESVGGQSQLKRWSQKRINEIIDANLN